MSDERKAVFLSYASQDADAARKICEALRAAGVEVWFDQNELRGGDTWDQKIRRQIKECTLFLPMVSAGTQARREGYFRLEWKLADDRTHLMARGTPFLVPICIDDTKDWEALVPDSFMAVQWTRLPGGEASAAFCARVQALLGGGHDVTTTGRPPIPAQPGARPAAPRARRRIFPALGIAAGLLLAAAALGVAWWPRKPASPPDTSARKEVAAPASIPAPPSKAQQLVAQARTLYEPWDFASPEDFKLAERLLKEASEIEPANADASAALAFVSFGNHAFGFDRGDARDALLRSAADRAVKLAPKSDFARTALALRYRRGPGTDEEAARLLRELADRHPEDKFILRQLGSTLSGMSRDDEAIACFVRAAALPDGDAIALTLQARSFQRLGRIDEAEAAVGRALALRPDYWQGHITKLVLQFYERGDIDRTRLALQQIPARVMTDDRVASVTGFFWYFARDADKAAEALRYVTHDYIQSNVISMPKGLLAGLVHQMAGRPEAAALEWRQALRVLEQRLAADPTSSGDLGDKAGLLALLGERAAAEEALRVFEQLRRLPAGRASNASWTLYAHLGREAEVIDFFTERLKSPDGVRSFGAMIRYHPALDPFRQHPRFQALAAEVDRLFKTPAPGSARAAAPGGAPPAAK